MNLKIVMQNMPSIVSSATLAFQPVETVGEEVYRGKRVSSPSVRQRLRTLLSNHSTRAMTIIFENNLTIYFKIVA